MRSSRPRLLLLAILSACFLATTSVSTPGQAAGQSVAQAVPQLPSNWNDAVQSLAAKIANLAGHDRNISLEVRNISSLTSADDAAIRQSLESELTRRRFRLLESSQAEAQVVVTLSENVDSYIWVSQVHTDSADHVAINAVTKTNAASSPNTLTAALALEKNLIWQQPASFLDFAFVGASDASASTLAILEPDRLEYYFADFMSAHSVTWRAGPSVPIPHSTRWPRDLRGSIDHDKGEVQVANVRCTGSLAEPDTMQCAAQAPPLEPQTEF